MAVVDVTGRLTNGWERLACAAQELGLRILLNEVAVVAETADVTLDRLLAEPVALVFATHEPGEEFRGLPELIVGGLGDSARGSCSAR